MRNLIALAVGATVLAMTASTASADDPQHHGGAGPHTAGPEYDMSDMMMRMHGSQGSGGGMPGMGMMHHGGMSMTERMPMMRGMQGMGMMEILDQDGDGIVTAEEARSGLAGLLSEYDSDGDGTLSLDEFETLHSALIRETMVDRFQHLDADGDGRITGEEMAAPAERMDRMQMMRDRMMQGAGDGQSTMPGQGQMMDGNGNHMAGPQDN